jgi:uncharacterized protein Yka (UPF0111/DUF47 family)
MPEQQVVRFTEALSGSLDKLFKTGGFALAFGFAGIIMMLGAKLFGQNESQLLIIIGAVLTFSCLGFFLYTTLKSNKEASKAISDNKEAIDAVQDIAIQLTQLTSTAQSYSFKNLEMVNRVLNAASPVLKSIPGLGDKVSQYGLDDVTTISKNIVENSERIETAVKEIENALINADHRKLREYAHELSEIVAVLRQQLKK